MRQYAFTLNGQEVSVSTAPDMPLLWVLRDLLGLTGTKFGCGAGLCGACTVILDGNATRSCVTPVSSVVRSRITTIEGLSDTPLQRSWIREQVPQCGYCQSGMIMSATALLSLVSGPTDREIDDALGGNICRCGTYQRIRRAVHAAATEKGSSGGL